MARRHRRRTAAGRRIKAMPDVTPIVNVALVLLIIFIVVMPIVREGIEVVTPAARNAEALAENAEQLVVLSIKEDGAMFVNLVQVDRNSLKNALQAAYQGQEGNPVIIKGAANLPYRDILDLMTKKTQ